MKKITFPNRLKKLTEFKFLNFKFLLLFSIFLLLPIFTIGQSYQLIAEENFDVLPETDLVPNGACQGTGGDAPGGIPNSEGTYILTDLASSPLFGWNNPSGVVDGGVTPPSGVNSPTGNFLIFKAFGVTGASCESIADDNNANGVGGELACFDYNNLPAGAYSLTSFFAELTNTNPHTSSYGFVVSDSNSSTVIANIPSNNISQSNINWQYNEGLFILTGNANLRICMIQTNNEGGGADIAMDNFALYRIVPGDEDNDTVDDITDLYALNYVNLSII